MDDVKGARVLSLRTGAYPSVNDMTAIYFFIQKYIVQYYMIVQYLCAMPKTHTSPPAGPGPGEFRSAILLFGEVLLDCFPDRRVVGGAPYNVARHLRGLGRTLGLLPLLVSRVGRDAPGREILAAMADAGLPLDGVQQDCQHATGRVDIRLDAATGGHRFEIPPDQAWDHINAGLSRLFSLAMRPERVYFGTLVQRAASRRALRSTLLASGAEGFLDVNLRDPWISRDVLTWSLDRAGTVKLNEEELGRVAGLFELERGDPARAGERLMRRFGLRRLVVTRDERGAWLLDAEQGHFETKAAAASAPLVDSVGAGDAFAAVFLLGLHLGWPPQRTLDRAHRFAGAVCGLRGATPERADFYEPFIADWRLAETDRP